MAVGPPDGFNAVLFQGNLAIAMGEGRRTQNCVAHVVDEHQQHYQFLFLSGQAVQHEDEEDGSKGDDIPERGTEVSDTKQLPVIAICRLHVPMHWPTTVTKA